jgi:ribosomal protein S18 acetylase RimI-like enzyme
MVIRPVEANDRDTFLRLCNEFYSSGATKREYDRVLAIKTFDYILSKHENLWGYIIAEDESGLPIGYTLVTSYWCNEDGGNVLIIDEVYVDRAHRNQGYGRKMIDWVVNEFKDKVVSVTLEVMYDNLAAKRLYSQLGFSPDGFEVMTYNMKGIE